MHILIVDDEPNIRRTLRATFEAVGHAVEEAGSGAEALELVGRRSFDVALVDVRLGDESGLELLEPLLGQTPRLAIVVITAYASIDSAVQAMRRGAFDYLPKPFTPAQVRAVLERVARVRGLRDRVADLEERVRAEIPEAELDSPDPSMRRAFDLARRVAPADAAVLLRGESGTGKGVLARALHAWSGRADGPFVTVSCPSLNADLLEGELFGHVRGAFTGAVRDAAGKVAAAEGGALFLDEVGDLPTPLQPKLLRFLQEKKYERVGDAKTRAADVRLIAATNRDLEAAVAGGSFREDLLYRLNVVEITLPPLRRRTDLLDLADHLLGFFARQTARRLDRFTPEARAALARHPWPGNLRELRNAVERAAMLAEGPEIGLADLPERIAIPPADPAHVAVEVGAPISLERLEVEHIRRVTAAAPSLEAAARILGMDPSTLYRKRKQFGI
ncbi:sigma-54-dependent transcriptional regulator [Paludisphaera mucosa]|uniref:Sigma-54 dependent transcriptional regulator n=1 Tax=Paludisphaera mucosa TaxID=3030827 RepID=A0ABT6FJI9_9BACT|nr:sigma-54 dependent transcriptional regulator [Paludisphaera mucosa]MDG3007747.1 sigma-54 dependent transcriptional regulator [Paludisphaera mucosa]